MARARRRQRRGVALRPPHGFVVTSEAARYLTVHHGPTFEQFVAAAAGEGDIPDPSRLTDIAAVHGIDIVGPPLVP